MPSNRPGTAIEDTELAHQFIHELFGIPSNNPALRNLLERLLELIPVGIKTGLLSQEYWSDIQSLFQLFHREHANAGALLASSSNAKKNPLPKMSDFPVAAALLQEGPTDLNDRYSGICILLLHYLETSGISRSTLVRLSNLVRIAFHKSNATSILHSLPDPKTEAEHFTRSLRLTTNQLRKSKFAKTDAIHSDNKWTTIEALIQLSESISVRTYRRTNPSKRSSEGKPYSTPTFISLPSNTLLSSVNLSFEIESSEIVNDEHQKNEAPDTALIYQVPFDLNQNEIPEIAFEDAARQVGYWVDKTNQLSTINRSTLNPLEHAKLENWLLESIEENTFKESLNAVLIAICLVTGLKISAIARASLGDNTNQRSVFTTSGEYIRPVWGPPDAGQGKNNDVKEKVFPKLQLNLPPLIQTWFVKYSDRLKFYSNLGSATDLPVEDIVKGVSKRLEHLRERGRYQITLAHIEAALPTLLVLEYHNPVITTLLAGDMNQSAPMLMHYQAIKLADLKLIYERVASLLLPQKTT